MPAQANQTTTGAQQHTGTTSSDVPLSEVSFSGANNFRSEGGEQLGGDTTRRGWGRTLGARIAPGAAGLGLGGVVLTEQQVTAGMMTTASANADRVAAGSSYAFSNGGNELLLFKDGAWSGGGSYWGDGKVISTFHQFNAGTAFQFGASNNHKDLFGVKYSVTDYVVFTDIDTVVAYVPELKNIRLNGVSDIAATSRPVDGSVVINTTSGNAFAAGVPLGEQFNGPLRAGEAWVNYPNNILFNNIDPSVLGRTNLDILNSNGLGVLPGASGHGIYNSLDGSYLGQTLGGSSSGPFARGFFLDISNQVVRDRINDVSFSAVPEPTSGALALLGLGALAGYKYLRKTIGRIFGKGE